MRREEEEGPLNCTFGSVDAVVELELGRVRHGEHTLRLSRVGRCVLGELGGGESISSALFF